MIELDSKSTALVLIDLQKGILGHALTPTTGQELLARGQSLAEGFRAARALVVLVNVAFPGASVPLSCVTRYCSGERRATASGVFR